MQPDKKTARLFSNRVLAAARKQGRATAALARLLAQLVDDGHLAALGYASLGEYARKVLDITPHTANELVRVARKLGTLKVLAKAVDKGHIAWSKAREIARIATPANEAAWVAHAPKRTVRELEQEIAYANTGDMPRDSIPTTLAPVRRRVYFELESADAEVLFRALATMRFDAGLDATEIEDGALLAQQAKFYLSRREERELAVVEGGESEAPTPSVLAGSGEESTEESAAENAAESAEEGAPGRMPAEPTRRTPSGERYRIVLEHCPECRRTVCNDAEVSDTVVGEARCDAEILEMRPGPDQGRVTRTIPPRIRRIVLHRARWRCECPGCTNGIGLDIHHTWRRADGGGHDPRYLVALCSTHHRVAHDGNLAVERLPNGAVRVEHADGRVRTGPIPKSHVGQAA